MRRLKNYMILHIGIAKLWDYGTGNYKAEALYQEYGTLSLSLLFSLSLSLSLSLFLSEICSMYLRVYENIET